MNKACVINASPLIILSRAQKIEILKHFSERILVPEPVAQEILMRGPDDITAQVIEVTSWIDIIPYGKVPDIILQWSLGIGESAVLAYAYAHGGMEAIIDDLAARKCAASLKITVRGTLGIVLTLKKRGIMPNARPILEQLIQAGLYLSKPVLDEALSRVGE